jgi:hypothetical protein
MGKAKKLAEGLKRIGDKVVKKRMTTKERNEMSKPFKKMLSEGQKSKKGMSKKDFDAAVKKGMAEDARIAKVKAENMAAATGPIKPVKKAAGGMMSPQPFTSQKPPGAIIDPPRPMPPRRPIPGSTGTLGDRALNFGKPRTQLIDPKLPRGKVGKGPLEPRDSTTRVPAERKGLAGILKKRMAAQAMNPPKLKKGPNDGRGGGGQPPFTPKLPGAKDGGMMKTKGYKAGGSVQKMKRGGSAGGAGNFLKGAARKIYQAKTAPLQVASRLAQRIAPDSLVAGGLRKAASPFKKGGLAIKGQGKAFKNSKR